MSMLKSYLCLPCNVYLSSADELDEHTAAVHSPQQQPWARYCYYLCGDCETPQLFHSEDQLAEHTTAMHSPQQPALELIQPSAECGLNIDTTEGHSRLNDTSTSGTAEVREQTAPKVQQQPQNGIYRCKFQRCLYRTKNGAAFRVHETMHKGGCSQQDAPQQVQPQLSFIYRCEFQGCRYRSENSAAFRVHETVHRKLPGEIDKQTNPHLKQRIQESSSDE